MASDHAHATGDLSSRAAVWALVVLLAARLILGFAYSAATPLGEAPDEADHYAYAAFIAREHRLPTGTGMTQAKHPPLFHALAAALINATGADADFAFLRSNPDAGVGPDAAAPNFFVHTGLERWPWQAGALSMHLGRLVSVLAGLILVAATYALGRAAWPAWYAGSTGRCRVCCLPARNPLRRRRVEQRPACRYVGNPRPVAGVTRPTLALGGRRGPGAWVSSCHQGQHGHARPRHRGSDLAPYGLLV